MLTPKDIKLWKVLISDDHVDPLSNLSLKNSDKLLAIRKILKYFSDSPLKEHIHVLVSSPEFTITSNQEQELLVQVVSLQILLNKSTHGMYKIVGRETS